MDGRIHILYSLLSFYFWGLQNLGFFERKNLKPHRKNLKPHRKK